jgi:hypothetical protein
MPDFTEISAWSLEEVQAHIDEILPKGWRLEPGEHNGHLWLNVMRPDDEVGWVVEWDSSHFDERALYLNVYGWLLLRKQPPQPRVSPWTPRRGELTQKDITRRVLASAPDPEDLDPKEVLSVYEEARKKRR